MSKFVVFGTYTSTGRQYKNCLVAESREDALQKAHNHLKNTTVKYTEVFISEITHATQVTLPPVALTEKEVSFGPNGEVLS